MFLLLAGNNPQLSHVLVLSQLQDTGGQALLLPGHVPGLSGCLADGVVWNPTDINTELNTENT